MSRAAVECKTFAGIAKRPPSGGVGGFGLVMDRQCGFVLHQLLRSMVRTAKVVHQ